MSDILFLKVGFVLFKTISIKTTLKIPRHLWETLSYFFGVAVNRPRTSGFRFFWDQVLGPSVASRSSFFWCFVYPVVKSEEEPVFLLIPPCALQGAEKYLICPWNSHNAWNSGAHLSCKMDGMNPDCSGTWRPGEKPLQSRRVVYPVASPSFPFRLWCR
jgi:hypothetical protein